MPHMFRRFLVITLASFIVLAHCGKHPRIHPQGKTDDLMRQIEQSFDAQVA